MEKRENKGLRCYFLNCFYFGGAQAGIQAQHAATRLSRKYHKYNEEEFYFKSVEINNKIEMINDWADNHETSIVLNAGMHGDLVLMEEFLESKENIFPWARFNESEYAANGCYTSIAIVLPDRIFDPKTEKTLAGTIYPELSRWECQFYEKIKKMPLMR